MIIFFDLELGEWLDRHLGMSILFDIFNYNFAEPINTKSDLDTIRIIKFPIIAYAYTDEGYKKIYQGINIIPKFKLKRKQEYHLKLTIV